MERIDTSVKKDHIGEAEPCGRADDRAGITGVAHTVEHNDAVTQRTFRRKRYHGQQVLWRHRIAHQLHVTCRRRHHLDALQGHRRCNARSAYVGVVADDNKVGQQGGRRECLACADTFDDELSSLITVGCALQVAHGCA